MSSISALRIIDAALNRAGEGLRVVEDYLRLAVDNAFLAAQVKRLRHDLRDAADGVPSIDRHSSRDTQHDVGTAISTQSERRRKDPADVCNASIKRTEQSLRSLEEYGKLVSDEFAGGMESLRYRLYTLEKAIDVGRASRDRLADVRLCVLVDAGPSGKDFEQLISGLVEAGVDMIQFREKKLEDRELLQRARMLVSIVHRQPPAPPGVVAQTVNGKTPPAEPGAVGARRSHTLAIINDRPDIAALVGADGVHLGQEDLSVKDARTIIGPRILIGVSTHSIEQARAAVLEGADYLGAGPTFTSDTKSFEALAGTAYLREVAAEIGLPTFAIGGISVSNLQDVLATGIERVAVSSAVVAAARPADAATEMLTRLRAAAGRHHSCDAPIQQQSPVPSS